MHQFLVINKDDKGRRLHRNLRDIIELQSFSLVRRRLLHGNGLCHDLVQDTRLHAHGMVFTHCIDGLKELSHTLPRLRGDEKELCIRHKA